MQLTSLSKLFIQDGVQDDRQHVVRSDNSRKQVNFGSNFYCITPFQLVWQSVNHPRSPQEMLFK